MLFINISQNSSISANQIKELAQNFMPTDNFTKELYHLYYQYSSICKEPNAQVSNYFVDFLEECFQCNMELYLLSYFV